VIPVFPGVMPTATGTRTFILIHAARTTIIHTLILMTILVLERRMDDIIIR